MASTPNSESLAATSAKEKGWEVFWPRYLAPNPKATKEPLKRVVSYLPGYVFVADNRFLSLWDLSKAKGVLSVLKVGTEYAMISDTDPVMRRLLNMADKYGFVEANLALKPITVLDVGDKVLLQDCPFELREAVIEEFDDDREGAWVWAHVFGGDVRMHVKYKQMKKAAA